MPCGALRHASVAGFLPPGMGRLAGGGEAPQPAHWNGIAESGESPGACAPRPEEGAEARGGDGRVLSLDRIRCRRGVFGQDGSREGALCTEGRSRAVGAAWLVLGKKKGEIVVGARPKAWLAAGGWSAMGLIAGASGRLG